jgi:hypothetical protein
MPDFTPQVTLSLKHYFESNIERHKINVQVLMQNGVGVAEHPDIMKTIEDELGKIAEYKDKLEALDTLEPHPQSTLSFLKEDGTSD